MAKLSNSNSAVFYAYSSPTGRTGIFYSGEDMPAEAFHGLMGLDIPEVKEALEASGLKGSYGRKDFKPFQKSEGLNASDIEDERTHIDFEAVLQAAIECRAKLSAYQTFAIKEKDALIKWLNKKIE